MPIDLAIRGANVVTPAGVLQQDLFIDAGKFVNSAAARQTIDAAGLTAFPGVIDSHVHFNEPGRPEWEGVATGSAGLVAGGGTMFFDMPLNSLPTLDGPSFDLKLAAAKATSIADFALWGGLTPINLDKLEELAARGVVGFKAFMSNSGIADFEHADDLTLFRGMQIAAKLGLPVAVHAESDVITGKLSAELRAAGKTSVDDYLASRPVVAEVEAISRAIALASEAGCKLHIVHVSSGRGVEVVRRAVADGICDATCETCPHYLALTEDDVRKMGPPAKCAPPLRPQKEVDALWSALASGKIEFVASDHSPAPASMKGGDDFFAVWGGVSGVQSTLSVLLSHTPSLSAQTVAHATSTHVARRYNIANKGSIEPGYDADLCLVDCSKTFTLTREMLKDRHKLSPYVGRSFRGVIERTLVRGHTVYNGGSVTSTPIGQLIRPRRRND